jgi:hypothetical protein
MIYHGQGRGTRKLNSLYGEDEIGSQSRELNRVDTDDADYRI